MSDWHWIDNPGSLWGPVQVGSDGYILTRRHPQFQRRPQPGTHHQKPEPARRITITVEEWR
jgi:hypothetical protein